MEVLATGWAWLGLLIGFLAGMAVQSARHAVKAHRTAKAALPKLKKEESDSQTRGAAWLLVVVGYVLFVLLMLAQTTAD